MIRKQKIKRFYFFLITILTVVSCSNNNKGIENQCDSVGNGSVSVKRNASTESIEYEIDSAYYVTTERSFVITNKSREYLNSINPYSEGINFYEIKFDINSTYLKEGAYTHLVPINSNDNGIFNISLTIRQDENSPFNFSNQYHEIPPNGGTLTITKNSSNCYSIDFEFITIFNDSIKGTYKGDFVDFTPTN